MLKTVLSQVTLFTKNSLVTSHTNTKKQCHHKAHCLIKTVSSQGTLLNKKQCHHKSHCWQKMLHFYFFPFVVQTPQPNYLSKFSSSLKTSEALMTAIDYQQRHSRKDSPSSGQKLFQPSTRSPGCSWIQHCPPNMPLSSKHQALGPPQSVN